MSTTSLDERVRELRDARVPFVHARVVLAEPPTSAKPGAEAIVLGDGTIEGFVGGSCAESTVRAQALALLDSGESLLLRITPDSLERSREYFVQALALDPHFALAHSHLAWYYFLQAFHGLRPN